METFVNILTSFGGSFAFTLSLIALIIFVTHKVTLWWSKAKEVEVKANANENRLNNLPCTPNSVKIDSLRSDVGTLKADMVQVKGDVVALKADMVQVKSDVATLKTDMVEVKSDVVTLKTDMVQVKSDIHRIDNTIVDIKKDMSGIRSDMLRIDTSLISIQQALQVSTLAQSHSPLSLTELGKQVAKEMNMEERIERRWEFIRPLIEEQMCGNTPYDIQQACQTVSTIKLEEMFSEEDMRYFKDCAYQSGKVIPYYSPMITVLIRDRYFAEKGIVLAEELK